MDALMARSIAHASHAGQRDRHGTLRTEHVESVAARVPREARAIAYLHEVLEWTDTPYDELRARGLTPEEASVLELLTPSAGEPYTTHVLRIAYARGPVGRLARAVKVADVEDHLQRASYLRQTGHPPYAWARRHLAMAQERRGERRGDQVAYLPTLSPSAMHPEPQAPSHSVGLTG
jgi:hypothetical protein